MTSSSVGKTPRSARQNVEAIFSPRLNPGSRYHWANTHSNKGKNDGESYRSFGVVNFYDLIFIAVFMIFLFWFVERNCQDMCLLPDWYRQKTTLLSCWLLPLKSHEALDDPRNDVHYLHVEYWFLWNLGSKKLALLGKYMKILQCSTPCHGVSLVSSWNKELSMPFLKLQPQESLLFDEHAYTWPYMYGCTLPLARGSEERSLCHHWAIALLKLVLWTMIHSHWIDDYSD